jgi:SAM-dependent methyltransferase
MLTADVAARIASFPRWHYELDLDGHKTPIYDRRLINRHRQRKDYLWPPLLRLCGGSLRGKRVLDLGCNAGFWSLAAVEAGCDFVLGIDGRAMHVEQAEFVFEVRGIDRGRYAFRRANVFDLAAADLGTFDVVLCLGVFYHVCKHVPLLEWIGGLNTDVLLIDTELSRRAGSVLEVGRDDLAVPGNACDYELVMVPSRAAVLDLVGQFGYDAAVLRPNFTDYEGAEEFRTGGRRAFLCARRSPLAAVADAFEPDPPAEAELLKVPARVLAAALWAKLLRRLGLSAAPRP